MIGEIQFVQYINESAYNTIYERLKQYETDHHPHCCTLTLNNNGIKRFEMFELDIKKPVHTYVIQSVIDYSGFNCDYESFPNVLYQRYTELFGDTVMADFPSYDEIICDYMELYGTAEVRSVDTLFKKLLIKKCISAQLDRSIWNEVESSHSKVKFCMEKIDKRHVAYHMCLHGRMLKSRIKDRAFHKPNGVIPSVIINPTMINDIIAWQLHIYELDKNLYKPDDIVDDLSGDTLQAANELINLAERLNLKAEIKYNPSNRSWKCLFTNAKPKYALLTLETSKDYFKAKVCLFNIDEYFTELDNISDNITDQIKSNGWDCNNCHDSCRGGVSIAVLGIKEKKCIGGAFTFEHLSLDEWRQIIEMIEKEWSWRK